MRIFSAIVKSPLLWGVLVTTIFYTFLHNGTIQSELLVRYLAMHPIEYTETGMFFIGMCALGLKAFDLLHQRNAVLAGPILPPIRERRVDTRSCEAYLKQVELFLRKNGPACYPNRLFKALKYVRQCESAEQLDSELKYLAEEDSINAEADYGFVQLIIWAIPILGFLGTVVGIAVAMGELDPEQLESSLPLVMGGLTVAFDTTAIALTFSIILFFTKYSIAKQENAILATIDQMMNDELRGRFELLGAAADNTEIIAVRKMLESVVDSLESLIKSQSTIWEQVMTSANEKYAKLAAESAAHTKSVLVSALKENVQHHAVALAQTEEQLLRHTGGAVHAMNESVKQNVHLVGSLQDAMVRQTDVFRSVIDATGQIAKLEDKLNQNLAALSGSRHFEETVNSLAAVIHLLNSKLTTIGGEPQLIQLPRSTTKGKGHVA
ncbi:MAG: MotA/TolQ/ExbB proton channel family protein [Planctomycetaceae bacterium]|nr:MotA/TolQ/ExbB proton channel family protein [Planctomycetaceae bacterium]